MSLRYCTLLERIRELARLGLPPGSENADKPRVREPRKRTGGWAARLRFSPRTQPTLEKGPRLNTVQSATRPPTIVGTAAKPCE